MHTVGRVGQPFRTWFLSVLALPALACGQRAIPLTPSGSAVAGAVATDGSAARPATASGAAGPATTAAASGKLLIPRYTRFELALPAPPPPANAGTSGTASVLDAVGGALGEVAITAPSGKVVRIEPFLAGDREVVRFAPAEIGQYEYVLRRPQLPEIRGTFRSIAGTDRGPVGIDPHQRHRLAFRDGTPFFILGENRINIYDRRWNYEHMGISDYIGYMARNGMTTLRVFVLSDAEDEGAFDTRPIGCLEPKIGVFDERAARTFDQILDAAEANGIYVILTAYAIGLTPNDTWKSWDDNAYNVKNGGPASQPDEVFTRSDLRAAAKRKLRYILARYGYSSHLLAVDLLNEPEWDGPIAESKWIPWARDLAADWHARDPYGHLVTVGSVGLSWNLGGDERTWYADSSDDLVQWHLYGKKTYDPHAHAIEMARRVRETYSYGKPVFCGEFAYGGEDHMLYDHTHTGLWSATFAGGGALAHSAPPFNLDSDEPMTPERGRHFRVLADFLNTIDWSRRLEPDDSVVPVTPGLTVLTLGSPDYKAFWLLGPEKGYGERVAGAKLAVRGLADGRYRIEWYDDTTGQRVDVEPIEVGGGRDAALEAPPFVRHLVAKLMRVAPARDESPDWDH